MRALLRSERGAIMVMALFMAIFATGCLHYLVGIAETIAYREVMQDAADAAAFSAAVLHARGMNVIALINMTMAALLAVLIALRLVELVSIAGVAISTGLAFVTGGASLVAVPVFTNVGLLATEAYEEAQPVVQTTLRALHIAARGVRIAIPWVAQARTVATVIGHYKPPVSFGFSIPSRLTLPTRDGTYDDLCTKAGEYVGDLVDYGLGPVPTPGFSIGEVTEGLIDTGSTWFCETDGAEPPATVTTRKVRQPLLPKAEKCQAYAETDKPDLTEHTAICAEATLETAASDAAIDPRTGSCVEGVGDVCGPDGLYELRATKALAACSPRSPSDEWRFGLFWWQRHRFTRRYERIKGEWVVTEPIVPGTESFSLMTSTPRPCGTSAAQVGEEWNTERWRDGAVVPICSHEPPPEDALIQDGPIRDVEHVEVLQIFRCREIVVERHELEGEPGDLSASDDDGDMAPQLIADGAVLGEEDFQLRAVVIGEAPSNSPDAMLRQLRSSELENDGDPDNDDHEHTWQPARLLGKLAIAQAELYFDEAGADPASYLWAMRWSARLRRFRLPGSEPQQRSADDESDATTHGVQAVATSLQAACELVVQGDFSCSDIDLDSFADIVAH